MIPSKPRVMVVDDEERFRRTMAKLLRLRGLEAATAGSGKEALERLQQETYDVVILDVRMPEMDGVSLLAEIKKADPAIEVIIITGYASVDTAREITRLGAYDYLLKPYNIDDLIEKIEAAHERRTTRRVLRQRND